MATIGLDSLYYSKITENNAGEETYGIPTKLAKAIEGITDKGAPSAGAQSLKG